MQYRATIIINVDGEADFNEVREGVCEVCGDEANVFLMEECGVENMKSIEFHSLEVIG